MTEIAALHPPHPIELMQTTAVRARELSADTTAARITLPRAKAAPKAAAAVRAIAYAVAWMATRTAEVVRCCSPEARRPSRTPATGSPPPPSEIGLELLANAQTSVVRAALGGAAQRTLMLAILQGAALSRRRPTPTGQAAASSLIWPRAIGFRFRSRRNQSSRVDPSRTSDLVTGPRGTRGVGRLAVRRCGLVLLDEWDATH